MLFVDWRGNRLTNLYFDTPDAEGIFFEYNADGIRTQKEYADIAGAEPVYTDVYTVDGSKILSEQRTDEETGNVIRTIYYVYDANGLPVGMKYNGVQYWYQKNIQGDVVRILNEGGAEVAIYTYDAWGKNLQITDKDGNDVSGNPNHIANINPFRYRGYYYDTETGWYYLNARYYDPNVGRFLSPDTILGANGGLQGYNLFAYCNNNPVMFADATGYALHRANTAYATLETDGRAYIGVCMNSVSISKAIEGTLKSFEKEQPKRSRYQNSDGSYSLYDNKRFNPDSVYHEQLFVVDTANPSFNVNKSKANVFGAGFTAYKGGWETEYIDLSLLDFGQGKIAAGFDSEYIGVSAIATAWAPSVSFSFFGLFDIKVGANLGSVGFEANKTSSDFTLGGAALVGFSINISWGD